MCGRYVSVRSDEDLTAEFDVEETVGEQLPPSWNVAPTDPVRIIAKRRPHGGNDSDAAPLIQLRTARWGLVPGWTRPPANPDRIRKGDAKLINARIETVTEKPAFKTAAARRRCLVPALGYYEWQPADGGKVPYFLHDPDGQLLAMAGLYELWRDRSLPDDHPDRWVWTCTIITQQATDLLGEIHDRNPVVVPAELWGDWLDCSSEDVDTASRLLERIPEARLDPYVVSAAVGNVRNNGPELIKPIDEAELPVQPQLDL
jgi:putative SOS response-associated peptidase YedK